MADAIFDNPRLAEVYDPLDPDRSDLDVYVAMVEEFGARSVLDIGCGTGTFACMLANRGVTVIAVDPAAASLDVARRKPGSDRVHWIHGDITALPPLRVAMATMTANVAQVFVTDDAWMMTLRGAREALQPNGHLVFETRDPARRAWLEWNPTDSFTRVEIPGVGAVQSWHEVMEVKDSLVSFQSTVVFETDGATIRSNSTLRFRSRPEIEVSLTAAGLITDDVRDAPDRPGREFVFIARRTQ